MGTIEEFLKRGVLVSPEVASKISPGDINELSAKLDKKEAVLTEELYSLYTAVTPKVLDEYKKEGETKKITKFVDFYNKRFEFLRDVLVEKTGHEKTTSLNKLSPGGAVIIGMVREIKDNGFTLEDTTGSVFCRSDSMVIEDEVIAAKGKFERNVFHVEKIFHPDIPLTRKVNVTERDLHVLFTGNLTSPALHKHKAPYIITFGAEDSVTGNLSSWLITKKGAAPKGNLRLLLNLPARVDIGGVTIMFFQYETMDEIRKKFPSEDEKKLLPELLKRRHMLPFLYKDGDPYLLREIPDIIFFTGGKESFFINYKGVSVISVTGEDVFVVNLKTREFQRV